MATIKKYQDKDGNTRYQFQVYLGVDPQTGKRSQPGGGVLNQKVLPVLLYPELK
ncbi:hypothetical protein IYO1511_c00320 [Lactiplantibacillus plantarum]|nr:hypothetical protein IYO1511_c00320 [Lactiplantibacillus plantarum]